MLQTIIVSSTLTSTVHPNLFAMVTNAYPLILFIQNYYLSGTRAVVKTG